LAVKIYPSFLHSLLCKIIVQDMLPNETVEKPLVRKMFIKISHNRLKNAKMLPKCCAEHQKPDVFQRFCPTFQKLFLKRDFFDSFNGLRYRRLGGKRLGNGKPPKLRNNLPKRARSQPSGARCVGQVGSDD
jgi:hypothetical protein